MDGAWGFTGVLFQFIKSMASRQSFPQNELNKIEKIIWLSYLMSIVILFAKIKLIFFYDSVALPVSEKWYL